MFSSCRAPKRNFPYCLRESGLVVWFTLRVREVPGSITGCPLSPFNFNAMFRETSWIFSSCRATKRNFRHCLRDSGLVVWFSFRVRELPGSIPGSPLFPFSFNAMFQETSWVFSSCRATKRNFRHCLRDSGLVVWFWRRVRELPGSIPGCPFSLLILKLPFKRRHESFRVVEHKKETFCIVWGTVV